jgi:hypothetical protein
VGQIAQFGYLAAPDEGARVDFLEVLEDFSGDVGARALRQLAQLAQRVFRRDPVGASQGYADQNGTFTFRFGCLICWRQGYPLELSCADCIRSRPLVAP